MPHRLLITSDCDSWADISETRLGGVGDCAGTTWKLTPVLPFIHRFNDPAVCRRSVSPSAPGVAVLDRFSLLRYTNVVGIGTPWHLLLTRGI